MKRVLVPVQRKTERKGRPPDFHLIGRRFSCTFQSGRNHVFRLGREAWFGYKVSADLHGFKAGGVQVDSMFITRFSIAL